MRLAPLLALLWVATISLGDGIQASRVLLQESAERLDESFISSSIDGIPFFEELRTGEPLIGTVSLFQPVVFGFSVERRDNEFPNILMSMVVSNPVGSADMFCSPLVRRGPQIFAPSALTAVWASNHTEGADFIFISRNHTSLLENVRAENTARGVELFVDIICTLTARTPEPADFELELDADFSARSLVEEEMEAIQSIFTKCCIAEDACGRWMATETVIFGADEDDDLPPFDLCHVPQSVCDEGGQLIRLNMVGWGLECEFPLEELTVLEKLQKLDVSHNNLTGDMFEIAGELQSLRDLVEFRAAYNSIAGTMDSERLCDFVRNNMTVLDLEGNQITGPLPDCLFDFTTTLTEIYLGFNNLSSSIPDVFPVNSTIEVLGLRANNITGSLPSSMSNLTTLRAINLQENNLEGSLPEGAFPSSVLATVLLADNELSGKVPSSFATSSSLVQLFLNENSFTELPQEWITGNLTGIQGRFLNVVHLGDNNFTGEFPQAFPILPNLAFLDISNNNFTGPLPGTLNMFLRAWSIVLANNTFSGTISNNWGTSGILTGSALAGVFAPPALDLSNNMLTGDIPEAFLNVDFLPPEVLLTQAIKLGGNELNCPENRTTSHLQGLEC